MSMTPQVDGEPLKFVLIDRTPGSDVKYYVQAPSEEVKATWIREIRSILDMQGDFLRGEVPGHHKTSANILSTENYLPIVVDTCSTFHFSIVLVCE